MKQTKGPVFVDVRAQPGKSGQTYTARRQPSHTRHPSIVTQLVTYDPPNTPGCRLLQKLSPVALLKLRNSDHRACVRNSRKY